MRALVLIVFVLSSAGVLAAPPTKGLGEFDEARQPHQRSVPTSRVNHYADALQKIEKPFPWRAVGLMAIALVVAAPFGIRTWRNLAQEMGAVTTGERGSRPKD